jgi:hypothetical protein
MIDAARKPETNKPGKTRKGIQPALLPQDPTVCQTLPGNPDHQRSTTPKRIRTNSPVRATRHLFVDIPPLSTRRRTCVCATGIYS